MIHLVNSSNPFVWGKWGTLSNMFAMRPHPTIHTSCTNNSDEMLKIISQTHYYSEPLDNRPFEIFNLQFKVWISNRYEDSSLKTPADLVLPKSGDFQRGLLIGSSASSTRSLYILSLHLPLNELVSEFVTKCVSKLVLSLSSRPYFT